MAFSHILELQTKLSPPSPPAFLTSFKCMNLQLPDTLSAPRRFLPKAHKASRLLSHDSKPGHLTPKSTFSWLHHTAALLESLMFFFQKSKKKSIFASTCILQWWQVTRKWKNTTKRYNHLGTSLAVQWLRLHASTAGGVGLIPCWGTRILHAALRGQKKRYNHSIAVDVAISNQVGVDYTWLII